MRGRSFADACAQLAALDVVAGAGVGVEAAQIWAAFDDPGPLLMMTNGDMATNNYLVDGIDGRIIDFEFAGYQHALLDCTWIHVGGPAWVVVNDPEADRIEAAYRTELCAGVPEAGDDDLFDTGMAMAAVAMAIERIGSFPKLDARPLGEPSRLQRVVTLEAGADQAERRRHLPHLAGWLRQVARALRHRWPDADVDFATYPAYSPRY